MPYQPNLGALDEHVRISEFIFILNSFFISGRIRFEIGISRYAKRSIPLYRGFCLVISGNNASQRKVKRNPILRCGVANR